MVNARGVFKERRRAPRIKCDFDIEIAQQKKKILAHAVNISSCGMYLVSNHPISLFREIGVGIKLPGIEKLIECSGVIVRSEKDPSKGHYNLAIFFDNIAREDKKRLSEYVKKKLPA